MARVDFIDSSYRSRSQNADCQVTYNWLVENVESGQGKGPRAFYDRPGLKLLYNLGSAGGRGITTAQGRTFAVAGTVLWELNADGASTNRGSVVSDGLTVSLANGQTQLLLTGAAVGYVFDLNTNTLTNLTAALGAPPVLQGGYADGFFFALLQGPSTNFIQASNLQDATSWDPVAFTGISVFPERANAIFFDHREMWVFGPKSIQPYWDAGDFPFAYDAIQGGFIESGIAARFSVAKVDNSIFWLESDDRGSGIVRRANGYTPVRVSDHALEYELSTYPTIADAIAHSIKISGHELYILTFPTAEKTKVYDTSTGRWTDWGFWNTQQGVFTRHRGQYHTFNFGKHLVLDPTTGAVYDQSDKYSTDFGNAIRRDRIGPNLCTEQEWMRITKVEADVESGLATLQGNQPASTFYLQDSALIIWRVQISDTGNLETDNNGGAGYVGTELDTLILSDPIAGTSWQVGVNLIGVLFPASVPFTASYPGALKVISDTGNFAYTWTVTDLGGGIAQFDTTVIGIVGRGPQLMFLYSKDKGRTWIEREPGDTGQIGEYEKRTIWRRLGRARNFIPRIVATDPVPMRIAELYVEGTGFAPQKRFAHEARERA
jgi:hypothetical protein